METTNRLLTNRNKVHWQRNINYYASRKLSDIIHSCYVLLKNIVCSFNVYEPYAGHTHVAEYLKVPLHVFFTMPWT